MARRPWATKKGSDPPHTHTPLAPLPRGAAAPQPRPGLAPALGATSALRAFAAPPGRDALVPVWLPAQGAPIREATPRPRGSSTRAATRAREPAGHPRGKHPNASPPRLRFTAGERAHSPSIPPPPQPSAVLPAHVPAPLVGLFQPAARHTRRNGTGGVNKGK